MQVSEIDGLLHNALILQCENKFEEASKLYTKILEINPNEDRVYHFMGIMANQLGNQDKAIKFIKKAIEINPIASYYKDIGDIYFDNYNIPEVINSYTNAINLNTTEIEVYHNLALAYWYIRNFDKAFSLITQLIQSCPDYIDAQFTLGNFLLQLQNFDEGWKYYELRFCKSENVEIPKANKPKWNGESLAGKTIYVFTEQGYGDSIQFVKYLPLLKEMGAEIIFKPRNTLYSLFKDNLPGIKIISEDISDDLLEYDFYIPLLSIPGIIWKQNKAFLSGAKYLKANTIKAEAYKRQYFENDIFKIGIFWKGNPNRDKDRFVPIEHFFEIAKIENIKLYALQKGDGCEDLNKIPEGLEIINLGETFNDFCDSASAIENLDLIITTDSSIAHLAGALGKPVWILLSYTPEWRWFLEGEETIWYNSAKLFRQEKIGCWNKVFETIKNELYLLINKD